jgi:hypothetical protein
MIKTIQVEDRLIAVKGIGQMFYQDGFPISMAVSELSQKGIEVSILHVADECLKNGWSAKTTINKLVADFADDGNHNVLDKEQLTTFCNATYEQQRQMIYDYLFTNKEYAKNYLTCILLENALKQIQNK